jgi:hypothetical protein
MDHKHLVSELRRLFAEEKKVQWAIGDLLVQQFGPANRESTSNIGGAYADIEELANELGVSLGTLLRYRRMASTYAKGERIASASFAAHEAAASAKDPAKVMAEAKAVADKYGERVTVPSVREVAAKPKHQNPILTNRAARDTRRAPGGAVLELISAEDNAASNLRRIRTILSSADDDLSTSQQRQLLACMDRCEDHIAWIRAFVRGENVADEAAEFLTNERR